MEVKGTVSRSLVVGFDEMTSSNETEAPRGEYLAHLRRKVEQGLEDARQGRVLDQEEVEKRMAWLLEEQWLEEQGLDEQWRDE